MFILFSHHSAACLTGQPFLWFVAPWMLCFFQLPLDLFL